MDEVLNEIKSKTDIVNLVSGYVSLKKSGRNYQALCPFHREKTPSFMVSPELQIFKCFGCSEGGDAFSFLMKMEGLDFPAAVKVLAEKAGVKVSPFKSSPGDSRRQRLWEINHLAAEFFGYLLWRHRVGERARLFLEKRGVKEETAKEFALGYAPASWHSLSSFLLKKGYRESELVESGLSILRRQPERDLPLYDRFRGRLVFPLKDGSGRVLGFSGRSLDAGTEPKYLNSPETPIFKKGSFLYGLNLTKTAIKKEGRGVIVEGQFDLILPYQEGFKNLVAALGTALTEEQLALLSRFTNRIILAFDADAAGSAAMVRSVRLAENQGFSVSILALPPGAKDPDEAVRHDRDRFAQSFDRSQPFYDFYLDWLSRHREGSDFLGRKKAAEQFLAELIGLKNPLTRSHYVRELAQKMGFPAEALAQRLAEVAKTAVQPAGPSPLTATEPPAPRPRRETLENYFLYLALHAPPETVREVVGQIAAADFGRETSRHLFLTLKRHLGGRKEKIDPKSVRDKLGKPAAELFDEIFLSRSFSLPEGKEGLAREMEGAANRLQREAFRAATNELSLKIKEAEARGAAEEVERLRQELQKLTEKLK